MAVVARTNRELSSIARKQQAKRDMYWPMSEDYIWDRKKNKGFATIPKTMPLILRIMDEMTKGTPVSSTFLALWCNTWDNSFVELNKPGEMAFNAGFSGLRAEYTWAVRLKKLKDFNFIDATSGRSGPMSNVIIWNPHLVLRWHYFKRTVGLNTSSYNALLELALDVGAKDMFDGNIPDFDKLKKRKRGIGMSLKITSQFKSDYKKYKKDKAIEKELAETIKEINSPPMDKKYLDHPLKGEWVGYRDCHIRPDLILIYKKTKGDLSLARIGTHSDLF